MSGAAIRKKSPTKSSTSQTDQWVSSRRQGAKSGYWCRCEAWASQAAVIPEKAGIHSANPRKAPVVGLDSRFRGNDRRFERGPIPNDTTTHERAEQSIIHDS
jgi:hypothetical protein